MNIKTLDELRQTDIRTQHFTPFGLGTSRILTPESAAEFQQQVIATSELADDVADGTRQTFERLRTVFSYGVLCYDLFTVVHDLALLVIEQALRDRFLEYHGGVVTFANADGTTREVRAESYDDVHDFLDRHRRPRPQLRLGDGPETLDFNGTLGGLRKWARAVGLLRGQRNRRTEQAIASLRNMVAHPSSYHLLSPVDAAHTVSDLCEIINHLWGHTTPGGRLYPAPIQRNPVVLAWQDGGDEIRAAAAEHLTDEDGASDDWRYAVIRGVYTPGRRRYSDHDLLDFHSRYEVTSYPSEWLWGAGTRAEATAWYLEHQPRPDECDYLDRVFAVRHHDGRLYLPMRPDVAAVLPDDERSGTWHIVRADYPNDAYHHVRTRLTTTSNCQGDGPCNQCQAEHLASGDYPSMAPLIETHRTNLDYTLEPLMDTPFSSPRSYLVG